MTQHGRTPWWRMAQVCAHGLGLGLGLGLVCASSANAAQTQSAAGIYSCLDANGRRHTSDRPITECLDLEQRVLNRDGSQRQTLPPRMNAEEQAIETERKHQQMLEQAAQKDAVRRDRNLMLRFPNIEAHNKARESALDDLRKSIATSERRLTDLQEERKPLMSEAEFYSVRRQPAKLRGKLEANEALQTAQKDIIQNQTAELARVNALFDVELARLRKLWGGAAPGFGASPPSGR